MVHPHLRLRLLSIDVAERDVVGAKEVCGGFAGFLAVNMAEGLSHLSWVVSGGGELAAGGVYSPGPFFPSCRCRAARIRRFHGIRARLGVLHLPTMH